MSIFEEYGAFSDTLNPKHSTCHLGKNIFFYGVSVNQQTIHVRGIIQQYLKVQQILWAQIYIHKTDWQFN